MGCGSIRYVTGEEGKHPVVVRSEVPQKSKYGAYREDLRVDFWFSCAYCTTTEVEALAVSFEIDHYVPWTLDESLKHTYSNLMWSCQICNGKKSDYFPSPEAQQAGYRFFRPDLDDPNHHFELVGLRVAGTSKIGEYTEKVLYLNRKQLRDVRELRRRWLESTRLVLGGLRELMAMKLDTFPVKFRAQVLKIRQELKGAENEAKEALRLVIEEHSKSTLIDPDPDKRKFAKQRRAYLKGLDALHPEL